MKATTIRKGWRLARAAIATATLAICASLPAQTVPPFVDVDLGSPAHAGSVVTNADDSLTITGGGSDIWNTGDQCTYFYTTLNKSQWLMQIKMDSDILGGDGTWAKCEVMCRESASTGPAAGDPFIALMYTKPSGADRLIDQFRTVAGRGADWYKTKWPSYSPPIWLDLFRNGCVFSLYCSEDGNNWTDIIDIDTSTNAFTGTDNGTSFGTAWPLSVTAGIAVTAHNNAESASVTISDLQVNLAPVLPVIGTQTVNELSSLTVTNTATESDILTNLGYVLINPPAEMSIDANGIITWTPQQSQSPSTNLVTTVVTNSTPYDVGIPRASATNTFTVIVNEVNVAPVLPVIGTQTVNELTLLTVTNTATESNIHSTLGYSLINPPIGMAIDANGIITWTPQQSQSPSTNLITTIVTNSNPYDLVNPHLSATNSFTVVVNEVNVAPVLLQVSLTQGYPRFTWNSVPGWHYQMQCVQAITDRAWQTIGPILVATNMALEFTDTTGSGAARFYRVQVLGP